MHLLNIFSIALPEGASEWLLAIAFLIVVLFWIRTIIEIANSRFSSESGKSLWLIVVILLPVVGMVLYWLMGRGARVAGG